MNFTSTNEHRDNASILHVYNLLGYIVVLFHLIFADPSTYDFPIILWWWKNVYPHEDTPSLQYINCGGESMCLSSSDRYYIGDPRTKGIIFYGSRLNPDDLPLPRRVDQLWNLIHEESPMNNYMLSHRAFIELFNYTATFRRESDYPLTSQYIYSLHYLTERKPVSTEDKNRKIREQGYAPILYIQSHSRVASDRDSYVQQLMKFISVDSYGKSLHNKDLPESMRTADNSFEADGFLDFISHYKFHIAFENAICRDYMTEKLMRSLHVGSIPIYLGSPDVRDWMPNNNSVIVAQDFESPEDLANYIHFLNENDKKYEGFLKHKSPGGVTNSFLSKHLRERDWHTHPSGSSESGDVNMFLGFECYVCKQIQRTSRDRLLNKSFSHTSNISHIGCPEPKKSIISETDTKESSDFYWTRVYRQQGDKAMAVRRMVDSGESNSSLFYRYYWTQSKYSRT